MGAMTSTLRIRPLRATDEIGVADFYRRNERKTNLTVQQLLPVDKSRTTAALVAEADGAIVGLIHASAHRTELGPDYSTAVVDLFWTELERDADVGPRLIDRLTASLFTAGYHQVMSFCSPDSADDWYDAGWKVTNDDFGLAWTESEGTTAFVRSLTPRDLNAGGYRLAVKTSEHSGITTWPFPTDAKQKNQIRQQRVVEGFPGLWQSVPQFV